MISNKKLGILKAWKTDIFVELAVSEIMKSLRKNTKTWVFNAVNELVDKKILNKKKKANINLYKLNLKNQLTIQFLQYLDNQDSINFPKMDIISDLIDIIKVKTYSLIVFGSYAKQKQTNESDLDICFLIENKDREKQIKPYVNEVKLNFASKIDDHYITFEDFIKMLLRSEENLGKQIFKEHKLFYNHEIFYSLLKEANKNGFRG